MQVTNRNRILLCMAVSLLLACVPSFYGEAAEESLPNRRVADVEVEERGLHMLLSRIANEYRIPIGFEEAQGGGKLFDRPLSVNVKDGTVRDVMDAFVRQAPGYEWKMVDRVINVVPKKGRDGFLEGLLKVRVGHFSIARRASLHSIRSDLVEIPEIKSHLEQAGVRPFIVSFVGPEFHPAGDDFTLDASDTTLRGLLNRIIRESEAKYWILGRRGANNEDLILNF